MINYWEMLWKLLWPKIKPQPSFSVGQIFIFEIRLLIIIFNLIPLIDSFYINLKNDLHRSAKITNTSIYSQYYEDNLQFYLNDGTSNYYYRPSSINNQQTTGSKSDESNQNQSTTFKIGNSILLMFITFSCI